MNIETR